MPPAEKPVWAKGAGPRTPPEQKGTQVSVSFGVKIEACNLNHGLQPLFDCRHENVFRGLSNEIEIKIVMVDARRTK